MLKLKNISLEYGKGKPISVKVGEATIPPYVTVGALLLVGIVVYLKSISS